MIVVTTAELPGHHLVEVFGEVHASQLAWTSVPGVALHGAAETLGRIHGSLLHARQGALNGLTAQAGALGANAVVGTSFATARIRDDVSEVALAGTAVRVARDDGGAPAVQRFAGQAPLPAPAPSPPLPATPLAPQDEPERSTDDRRNDAPRSAPAP